MNSVLGNLRYDLGLNTGPFDAGLDKADKSIKGFAGGVTQALAPIAGALAAVFSVKATGTASDQWSEFNARLKNATGSAEAGAQALDRLQVVARRSYSSIEQTTEAFLNQSTTLNALGVSTEMQLDLTEALNNALVISATRGQKAESTMDAWGKAMALGELRGQNLNTVIAGSDRLAQALADTMGINITELREYGAQGKITREVMLGVTSQLEALRDEAADMPATLADGATIMGDSFLQLTGRVDQALGTSESFAGVMVGIGDTVVALTPLIVSLATAVGDGLTVAFDVLGPSAAIAVAAITPLVAASLLSGIGSLAAMIAGPLVAALGSVNAILMANPILGWIGAFAAVITAVVVFRDEIENLIGVDVVGIFHDGANLVIGAMVGAVQAIQAAWDQFPEFMLGVGKRAWNAFLEGFEGSAITWTNPFTGETHDLLKLDLTDFKADVTEGEADVMAAAQRAFDGAMGVNYLENITDAVRDLWEGTDETLAKLGELEDTLVGGDGEGGAGGTKGTGKKVADEMAKALEAMRQALATEAELELEQHAKRLEQIEAFYAQGLILKDEYDQMIERANEQHAERMNQIARRQVEEENRIRSQLIGHASSVFGSLSTIMENFGEDNLGLSKAFAVAQAVINTAEGVTKALAQGGILGFAGAAAVAAAGAAQISTIMSANKGGSNRPTVGASAPSIQDARPQPQQQAVSISLQGDYHPTSNVEALIDELLKMQSDGYQIILDRS